MPNTPKPHLGSIPHADTCSRDNVSTFDASSTAEHRPHLVASHRDSLQQPPKDGQDAKSSCQESLPVQCQKGPELYNVSPVGSSMASEIAVI